MLEYLVELIQNNYILLVLEIILLILLALRPKLAVVDFRPLYITIGSILLCKLMEIQELRICEMPEFYTERLILSVLCYWLRPAYCLGLIYVLVIDKKKRIWLTIPEWINIVVMGLAFVPKIGKYVFYFEDETFYFKRGPLGYTVFIIGFAYVLILIYVILFRMREKKAKETWLIVDCSLAIFISTILEMANLLSGITPTLVLISCLVYYLLIYIQMTSVDELTCLYNREKYYADLGKKQISAVASIDMNGLKELNDSKGHKAGDAGLATIAKVIGQNTGRHGRCYRLGGDEFVVLFMNAGEDEATKICDRIRHGVAECGYSVSVGLASSKNGEDINDIIRVADERMYAEKVAHYGDGERKPRI